MTNSTFALSTIVMVPTIALVVFRYLRERPANIPPVGFSEEARATIDRAAHESRLRGDRPTTPEHLLFAMLADRLSSAALVLEQSGVDVVALRTRLLDGLPGPSRPPASEPPMPAYTNAARLVLERSTREAFDAHQSEVLSVHLLAGVLQDRRSTASRMLRARGVSLQAVRDGGRALSPR